MAQGTDAGGSPIASSSRWPKWREAWQQRNGPALAVLVFAALAALTPLLRAEVAGRVGLLLILTAMIELSHGFRRATPASQRAAWIGGGVTLGMGLLLINAPYLAASALLLFLAGWFAMDAVRNLIHAGRYREQRLGHVATGLFYLAVAAGLLLARGAPVAWMIAFAAALRMIGTATSIVYSPKLTALDSGTSALARLGLQDRPELAALVDRIADEEAARLAIDRGWIIGFIATLFAIHIGRMGLDRSALGVLSPVVAVLGDLMFALSLAFVIVIPVSSIWRWLTRGPERRMWAWCLAARNGEPGWLRRCVQSMLTYRLRCTIRLQQARYSVRTALSRGLQIGLPMAAIMAATVPVWGMSWFFDTENYATGIWNSWAAERTDTWREAMIRAVNDYQPALPPSEAFAVHPPGVDGQKDFSFIVIGDTGEGDASQHVLRAEFLNVVRRDDIKFVVLSSDVVYPTGAMRDYEANFWLPFMGATKPIYAIPGNHDWYDALEGFVATFMTPETARRAMRARIEADRRFTSTTDARIEHYIATASRLRQEYRVPTQLQTAPFFQFQTDSFALFAVDTGVARCIDPEQFAWLQSALESARGKTKMAILGHPLYAAGHYQAEDSRDFAALHQLLKDHEVAIVMAGDTHDLEYYLEPGKSPERPTLHFVNGGGGAYLSFGTSLAWPEQPATDQWAYYPNKADVVAKIKSTMPIWKRPAWWWTDRCGAWPFSPEWLSGAFDVNAAPFMQSFVVVHVEPSQCRVRLVPHGIHGPLKWSDFDRSAGLRSTHPDANAAVEWTVPMARAGK